jgi:Na+-translocating ferredoxin:NAD+ oxidoreductase subunit B
MDDVYKRLANRLDQFPNGFSETENGVELKILRKIFSPEEAEMALKIRPLPETAEQIAGRLGKPAKEMESILDNMVRKGQIGTTKMGGQQVYMLFPFVLGIYEFQLNRLDKELSDLVEEYFPALMTGSLGKHEPDFFRVVPINAQIKAEHQVLLYEDVRKMMDKAKSFQVTDCICRKERAIQGEPCTHSIEVCLGFSESEGAYDKHGMGKVISREEAFQGIEKAEEEGLVHQTYNTQSGHFFVCNCCSCSCGVLRAAKEFNAPHMMAKSNFVAVIDQETCEACGTCAEQRCPMEAINSDNDTYKVQPEQCIGCGVCTTTCPTESITLVRKAQQQQDTPPANLLDWYLKRAASRGIKMTVD